MMAHFRGTVRGGRGEASRLGHKTSGLSVTANSWEGMVSTWLYYNEEEGCDYARITLQPHAGSTTCLYHGPVGRVASVKATL